jgi:F-type H+-transporting ATPase subunit c
MDPSAAKLIGAGLASIALVGAGIGIGTIFGNYLQGALRNPSAAPCWALPWPKPPACSAS